MKRYHVQLYARSARKWVRLSDDFSTKAGARAWSFSVRKNLKVRVRATK